MKRTIRPFCIGKRGEIVRIPVIWEVQEMVYQAGTADLDALATLAALLWDSHSVPELRKEFAAVIEGGDRKSVV